MVRINIFIAIAVAAVTYGLLAYMNRPEIEPAWPERIQGFSFSPMRAEHDPITGKVATIEQIEQHSAVGR
jgi:hypothetical protein